MSTTPWFAGGRPGRLIGLSILLVAGAACGISVDDAPRDIDLRVDSSLVTEAGSEVVAVGTERIFFVAPDVPGLPDRLIAVARDTGDDPRAVVDALLAGPSQGEFEEGVRSALPATVTAGEVVLRPGGVLAIDLSREISEVTGNALPLALAQLVSSVDLVPGVSSALITVDGEVTRWPAGNGELLSGPLTVYDYPGLVPSAQPAYPAVPTPSS